MYGGNSRGIDEIVAEVKRTVIGQDRAVEWLCTFADAACARSRLIKEQGADGLSLPNTGSAMLVGPTASGKSHLMKTFAKAAGLLFHPIDGGQMTGEGWKGNSFSEEWAEVAAALDENPGRNALIFVDEVDKMFAKRNSDGSQSGTAVFDLLKPLEGGQLPGRTDGQNSQAYVLDCDRCVFVLAGAFTGIEDIVARRVGAQSTGATLGFGAVSASAQPASESELRAQLSLDDLEAWGIPREIIGRLSTICFLEPLGEAALRRIVHDNKQAEYGRMFPGSRFVIDKAAEDVLVANALRAHYGARSINQQLNTLVFGDVWREASRMPAVRSVLITAHDGTLSYRIEADEARNASDVAASEQERMAGKAAYFLLREVNARLAAGGASQIDPHQQLGEDGAQYAAALLLSSGKAAMHHGTPSVGNAFSLAEITLLFALHALLRDWFPKADFTPEGMRTLLSLANANMPENSPLDLLFHQIRSGLMYVHDATRTMGDDGNPARDGWVWVKTPLTRNTDGIRPAEVGGLAPEQDRALGYYDEFKGYPRAAQQEAIKELAFKLL